MKKKHIKRMMNNTRILDKIDYGDFRDKMKENYIGYEIETESVSLLKILRKTRKFGRIKCGSASLSVQANECSYCSPAETLDDKFLYKAMEIAIFTPDKPFATLKEAGIFYNKRLIFDVGPYIDIETIQYIYGRLCRKYKGEKLCR